MIFTKKQFDIIERALKKSIDKWIKNNET